MAGTPPPTVTVQVPGTVNPIAHAASWGAAKVHQIVQNRQKAVAPKGKPKLPGKSRGAEQPTHHSTHSSSSKKSSTTTTHKTTTHGTKPAGETPWYEQSRDQLRHLVTQEVEGDQKAKEAPIHTRLGEIGEIKNTGERRLGANTDATKAALSGLQTANEASAKTAENEAAEHAKQAVQNLGSGAEGAAPGVLNAEATMLGSIGNSGVASNAQRQAAESDFLSKLQGVAALRGQEQGANLAGKYAGQEGAQNAALAGIQAGSTGRISAAMLRLLPEQAKLKLAASELGVKKTESTTKRVLGENKNKITASNNANKNARAVEGNAIKSREAARKASETASQEAYRSGSLEQKNQANATKKTESEVRIKNYEAKTKSLEGQGKLTPTQGKAVNEISRAASLVKMWKEQGKSPKEMKEFLYRGSTKVANGVYAEAAIEVVQKGYLSAATKKALVSTGAIPANFQLSNYVFG